MKRVVSVLLILCLLAPLNAWAGPSAWRCPNCGQTGNESNFCPACGAARPAAAAPAEREPDSGEEALRLGIEAFDAKEYETALARLTPLADLGSAEAQWRVGQMYERGFGTEADAAAAEKYIRLSAAQGSARGLKCCADLYWFGHGVEKDLDRALELYQEAALLGDYEAAALLGDFYDERPREPAVVNDGGSLKEVATTTLTTSEGRFYNVDFVASDPELALRYRRMARDLADERQAAEAEERLAWTENYVLGLAAYDAKDAEAALAYLTPYADQGYGEAQWRVGNMYARGWVGESDCETGVAYVLRSANQGNETGLLVLQLYYSLGIVKGQQFDRMVDIFKKFAEKGDYNSAYTLSLIYSNGVNLAPDDGDDPVTPPPGPVPPVPIPTPTKPITICPKCHGEGKITCSQCDGNGGKWITDNSTKSTGRTWENCFKCKGNGHVSCTYCGGDGRINDRAAPDWTKRILPHANAWRDALPSIYCKIKTTGWAGGQGQSIDKVDALNTWGLNKPPSILSI